MFDERILYTSVRIIVNKEIHINNIKKNPEGFIAPTQGSAYSLCQCKSFSRDKIFALLNHVLFIYFFLYFLRIMFRCICHVWSVKLASSWNVWNNIYFTCTIYTCFGHMFLKMKNSLLRSVQAEHAPYSSIDIFS